MGCHRPSSRLHHFRRSLCSPTLQWMRGAITTLRLLRSSKSNFPSYGKDFPNRIPTGRFSNGRLVTDFVGEELPSPINSYFNYGANQIRRHTYSLSGYPNFLLQLALQLIQDLSDAGARNIAFVGLPPMGCLPPVITLNSDHSLAHRGCIESLCSLAQDCNHPSNY